MLGCEESSRRFRALSTPLLFPFLPLFYRRLRYSCIEKTCGFKHIKYIRWVQITEEFGPFFVWAKKPCFRIMQLYGLKLGNAKSDLKRNLDATYAKKESSNNQQWSNDMRLFEVEVESLKATESLVQIWRSHEGVDRSKQVTTLPVG